MRSRPAIALVGAWCASALAAGLPPTVISGEARMVTFPYSEDRSYLVLVRPRNNTHLRFAPDERVTYVSAGDSQAFMVTVPKSREFVEIKPKFENVTTNLLIVTNQRQYHLDLQSMAEGQKWYMRVSWQYGEANTVDDTGERSREAARRSSLVPAAPEELELMQGVNPAKLRFGYRIDGNAEFRPTQVFDDGTHTFVRLPEGLQELPALFMRNPDNDEAALVNYSVRPPYLVVQRTMQRFVLKLGRSEVKVDREEARRGWFSRRGER